MKIRMNTRVAAYLSVILLFGCSGPEMGTATVLAPQQRVDPLSGALDSIKQLPRWCSDPVYAEKEIKQLEQIGREMANYSLDEIYSALKTAEQARIGEDFGNAPKIYLLLRVLFELPESESYSTVDRAISSSSSFLRPYCYKDDCSTFWLGWPLEWDASGKLVRVRHCYGVKGRRNMYDFVGEFEAMRGAYPRRKFQPQ